MPLYDTILAYSLSIYMHLDILFFLLQPLSSVNCSENLLSGTLTLRAERPDAGQ